MDALINNTAGRTTLPQTQSADTAPSTLPSLDVTSIRSAAMSAATSTDSTATTAQTVRPEQVRIVIVGENPLSSVIGVFNGGRGGPFVPSNPRDALTIIDALSKLIGDSNIGLATIGTQGLPAPHAPDQQQRTHQHRSHIRTSPLAERETTKLHHQPATSRDSEHLTSVEHRTQDRERSTDAREVAKAEQVRERLERLVEKAKEVAVDRSPLATAERALAGPEKASDTPRLAPPAQQEVRPSADGPRPNEPQRTQELSPSLREAQAIANAAINAVLNDPRNDHARRIELALTGELANQPRGSAQPTTQPTHLAPTNVFEAREKVQEKLSQIRETIQTAIDRSSPTHSAERGSVTPQQTSNRSNAGDFTRFEIPTRDQAQAHTIAGQGRTTADRTTFDGISPSSKGIPLNRVDSDGRLVAPLGSQIGHGPQALRTAGALDAGPLFAPLEKGSTLIDALSKSTQRILNVELLRKLDQAIETVVISGAAAVVLGVMGAEALLKQLTTLGREVLDRLRESGAFTKEQEAEQKTIEEIVAELEETCRDRGLEKTVTSAGFVADITGVIVFHTTGLPVEGVVIDAGALGTAITDTFGEFRFKNIPLGTGFSLTCHDHRYSFAPNPLVGTVSTINHFTIRAA